LSDDAGAAVRSRDGLLGLLSLAAHTSSSGFMTMNEDVIDACVSMALTVVPEAPEDSLFVTALAMRVLAEDGQFARFRQLLPRVTDLAERLASDRPFLAQGLQAFAATILGNRRQAESNLSASLGLTELGRERSAIFAERNWENAADLALATGIHEWVVGRSTQTLSMVAPVVLQRSDALSLALLQMVGGYASAAAVADPVAVLTRVSADFRTEALSQYLRRRNLPTLFPAQLTALEEGLLDPGSQVLALPTSSGKTLLAELRIAVEIVGRHPGGRALYVAPYRLLARQVERSLRRGLRAVNLSVEDLGGSFDASAGDDQPRPYDDSASQVSSGSGWPDVGVCTPERLDGLVRLATSTAKGHDAAKELLTSVKLLIFDEAQMVARPGRGPRLEMLIARLRSLWPELPIVALSNASYGVEDLAAWLDAPKAITGGQRPTGTLELVWRTDGRLVQRAGDRKWIAGTVPRGSAIIDDAARLALRFGFEDAPILLVENTRPNAQSLARRLRKYGSERGVAWRHHIGTEGRHALDSAAELVRAELGPDHELADLLQEGIGLHHAGLPLAVLRSTEELTRDRRLFALVATTTVAEGADLPFRIVIIPHLGFQSAARKLERDLYLNIIGRAGRANVAIEGVVFLIDSDAVTLRSVVNELWATRGRHPIVGQLPWVPASASSFEELAAKRDVTDQVLTWLGEGFSGVEQQAERMARKSLSFRRSPAAGRRVTELFEESLEELEARGLARAASPFEVTELGRRARLAGLSPGSCLRLHSAAREGRHWLGELAVISSIDGPASLLLAGLLFEAEEVLTQGMWLRRTGKDESIQLAILRQLDAGSRPWPRDDALYRADVELLGKWIAGTSYVDLGGDAPTFPRGMFSSKTASGRAADAAELFGRVAFTAAWAYSGVRAMMGDAGDLLPSWVRQSIEFGVPSATAVLLVREGGLTRDGAVRLAPSIDSDPQVALDELRDWSLEDLESLGLRRADAAKVMDFASHAG
jgi:replicative superfamily II helicase